jgi:mRNA interferase YafQ
LRIIHRSTRFKKDYKNINHQDKCLKTLKEVINILANDGPLDAKFNDHQLHSNWKGYRELHLRPDLLLVYKVTAKDLRLARLASHSKIFQ